ncbi:hypothetical protein Ddc_10122 [Ditylenchus destructor]|nr:hypothetical protein Ddc_10122 [Ditylenchus destructor]
MWSAVGDNTLCYMRSKVSLNVFTSWHYFRKMAGLPLAPFLVMLAHSLAGKCTSRIGLQRLIRSRSGDRPCCALMYIRVCLVATLDAAFPPVLSVAPLFETQPTQPPPHYRTEPASQPAIFNPGDESATPPVIRLAG